MSRLDYDPAAEFYDVTGGPVWARKAPVVAGLLAGARPEAGPVLDLGAGTGLSTRAVADGAPTADVLATEPSPAMRAVLVSRVAADADLRRRVTVSADAAPELALPDVLGGAAALGVVGHLTAAERARLWARLAARLAPGAPLLVELMSETAPPPAADGRRIGFGRVGTQDYEVSCRRATPVDGEPLRLTFTYRVLEAGVLRREVDVATGWDPLTGPDLVRELAPHGLVPVRKAPDLWLAVAP